MATTGSDEPGGPRDPEAAPVLLCARLIRARLTPEFDEVFSELAELYEEDLSDEIVLNELTELLAELLSAGDRQELVERCAGVIEELVRDDRIDSLIVYDQLLGLLPPFLFERFLPYLGPATAALVASVRES